MSTYLQVTGPTKKKIETVSLSSLGIMMRTKSSSKGSKLFTPYSKQPKRRLSKAARQGELEEKWLTQPFDYRKKYSLSPLEKHQVLQMNHSVMKLLSRLIGRCFERSPSLYRGQCTPRDTNVSEMCPCQIQKAS
mgnify:CR=1 FL=1